MSGGEPRTGLATAVAAEVQAATAALSEVHRAALELRERRRWSYAQIAADLGVGDDRVPLLLAHARLALRARLRGTVTDEGGNCEDRNRSLAILARRQDSEPLTGAQDEDWIRAHLAECRSCERAHAIMLEASVCYRAGSPG